MAVVLHLKPQVPTVEAWQFRGQSEAEWPEWVDGTLANFGSELRHERPSGRQIVYWGEWLVRMPQGDVWWFTDDEMHTNFGG
jgi:hypothetical protein